MAEKSILIAIAKNEARVNGACYASHDTLALSVGCDERTITKTLKRLEDRTLVEITRTPGRSNTILIHWQTFAKLPPATPLKNEGGTKMRGVPPSFQRGAPLKNEGRGVKTIEGAETRGSAPGRASQDIRDAPLEALEKPERQPAVEIKKLLRSASPPASGRPADPLKAELWDGIFGKRIENVFFDSRNLKFIEQLHACVDSAVTDLVHNRRGKMMHLRAEEIKKRALERLNGAKTIELISDFGNRARASAIAVRNAVSSAAADLYSKEKGQSASR